MKKKDQDDTIRIIGAVLIVMAVLWWLCIIIVPVFPNTVCTGTSCGGGGGISGGSSGGVANTCPDPCRAGTHFVADINNCQPNPTSPTGGIPCPYFSTTMSYCSCPTGYLWDTGLFLCMPTTNNPSIELPT